MADLDNTRHDKEGLRDFVLRAEAELDTQADSTETRGFDFEQVRNLADPAEILRNWDGARVEEMVEELSQVRDQALLLGYDDLLRLVDSLLRVYEQLSGEPADEVIEALQSGHERLVIMFDEIAASQDITPAPDVIESLEAIDLGALETDKETQYFLKDCWEALGNLDAAIQQWEADPNNLKPVEQVSQHLSTLEMHAESRQASAMISLLEEMIRLCEAISAGEVSPGKGEAELLHAGRQSLIDQLEQIRQHADADVDEDLLALFRNRIDGGVAVEPPAQEAGGTASAEPDQAAEVVELPPDQVDEDILPIFLEEVDELLENIDQSVLDWSNDTGATEYLDKLLRHLHTLKG
ncbi:MAG: Hpt domain-containing protein, partial [Pseudomonadales bacterium]|nr:Hpt domain-containing protein [Pseudomonadales bacterium]